MIRSHCWVAGSTCPALYLFLLGLFLHPLSCSFHPLRTFQPGSTAAPLGPGKGLEQQQLYLQMFPGQQPALVLAALSTHCSNYIICSFNFESIFCSFYSNSMVHSHCRSPQPEYGPPTPFHSNCSYSKNYPNQFVS